MDHQFQPRQVNAARRHIGGNAHPRPTITQRLQGVHPFGLGKLSRQSHNLKTPVAHAGQKVVHIRPRLAKDNRRAGLVEPQDVENRMLPVAHGHGDAAVFDIGVLLLLALRHNPQRVLLERRGQGGDFLRHGGREHQRAAGFGCRRQNEFQIFGKAKVQHLVGLVQNDGLHARQIKAIAFDMVAQTARCADDDMRAAIQRALFRAIVHAANAGGNLGPGFGVKPLQLARHLLRQLACRRDDERQGRISIKKPVRPVQDFRGNRKAKGHRLARAGLRRHQHVAALGARHQNGLLHGGKRLITTCGKGRRERRGDRQILHVLFQKRGGPAARWYPIRHPRPCRQSGLPAHPLPSGILRRCAANRAKPAPCIARKAQGQGRTRFLPELDDEEW